ncbi:MAG: glycosyltransferase family 4 protein [Nitrospinota bacterium]|nr:glycosyltransferase family 4 protein [Nitrospinota bacterium]
MHILHSEAATGWGGQEIRIFQESQLLLARGHQVSIICQPGSPLEERCRTINDSRFHLYPIRMNGTLSIPSFLALYRRIAATRPHLLHTHSSIDSWQVSFCGKLLSIPIVRSRHVSIPVHNFFPRNLVYSYFPDRIITSGETIRSMITSLSGVSAERVVPVAAGVDMERFDPEISGDRIRQELNLAPDQPLIGKVGVIRGWKGHDFFLDAVPWVLEKFPKACFVIVGAGPGYEQIRQRIKDQAMDSAVSMLGHREDIPEIMAALNILVLASISGEATSQVIPQAFAMKTPVIGTRAGGIPEILGDGDRGILAEVKSSTGLAEGIITILQHPDRGSELAAKAFSYCREELTAAKMMNKTIAVYEDLLNSKL